MEFDYEKHTILATVCGSRAYGTNTPESDWDFKGVLIPPKEYFLGFLHRIEQKEYKAGTDMPSYMDGRDPCEGTIYDIRKFLNLAKDANPSILDVLFCDDDSILLASEAGMTLRENRHLFLSKKIKHTFSGYAYAQLKRIKTHREWLLNKPTGEPKREDFGLVGKPMSSSEFGAVQSILDKDSDASLGKETWVAFFAERDYRNAKAKWDQYLNWKANRNPARAELEERYGYDCKHASHLVRLMLMGLEALSGEGLNVQRPDAEFLLSIRNGSWSYGQLIGWLDDMDSKLDAAYKLSSLPHSADVAAIDNLCIKLVEASLAM